MYNLIYLIFTLVLLSGFLGVQHAWVLVHGVGGARLTVSPLVHLWEAQGFLDYWLLQPSRLPDSHETGTVLKFSYQLLQSPKLPDSVETA